MLEACWNKTHVLCIWKVVKQQHKFHTTSVCLWIYVYSVLVLPGIVGDEKNRETDNKIFYSFQTFLGYICVSL